jgi:ureidoacrylate peracid hydrolase
LKVEKDGKKKNECLTISHLFFLFFPTMLHLPRVLLLGEWGAGDRRAWAGQVAAALVGSADVVVRPTPAGWRAAHLLRARASALPLLIPSDGPAFAAAWLAVPVDDDGDAGGETWRDLGAAVRAAAGGAGVRLCCCVGGGRATTAAAAAAAGGWHAADSVDAFLSWLGLSTASARPLLPDAGVLEASADPDRAVRAWVGSAGRPPAGGAPPARFAPAPGPRAAPLNPATTALLMVDAQNFNCHPDGALYHPVEGSSSHCRVSEEEASFFFGRLDAPGGVADAWAALLTAARRARVFVLHTVIAAQDGGARDTGLDYRLSGFHVPPGCWDGAPVAAAAPARGEPVLPKTSSSPFASTPVAAMLRAAGATQLVLVGCVTDQCIAATAMDAADAGFLVTLVRDACLAYSQARHDAALGALSGYGRQVDTADVVRELVGEEGG